MNKSEEQLRWMVFHNLMALPAYKLKNEQRRISHEYTYTELNKLIKNRSLRRSDIANHDYGMSNETKSISEIYQRPNKLKILRLSIRLFANKYKLLFLIAILSYIFAFFVRANNFILVLIGVICFFAFYLSFLVSTIKFVEWYTYVDSTFSLINRTLVNIEDYINSFKNISKDSLDIKANLITASIIKNEIEGLKYDLKRLDIYYLLIALFLSWLFVYVFGDTFIDEIIWLANILNFGDFEVIQNLTTETFIFLALIPFGTLLARYVVVSGLKQRDKRLRQSLTIVKNLIKTDAVKTRATDLPEDIQRHKQLAITELFGTIEYEEGYDYKEQRRNS